MSSSPQPPAHATPGAGGRTLRIAIDDTEAMIAFGHRLAAALDRAACEQLLIDLRGELGAGKTVLVRGLAHALGLPAGQRVVSPTFTIARSYTLGGAGRLRSLHHVDAYRLRSAEDLDAVGFEEMCGKGRLTCVEWGEHVEGVLPMDRLRVTIRVHGATSADVPDTTEWPRTLEVESGGNESAVVLRALRREPSGGGTSA